MLRMKSWFFFIVDYTYVKVCRERIRSPLIHNKCSMFVVIQSTSVISTTNDSCTDSNFNKMENKISIVDGFSM